MMIDALSRKSEQYFEQLSRIPRPSKQEKAASDWIVEFARSHGLTYVQDEAWNVIIKKDAAGKPHDQPGDPVILQAHLDMVCVPADYDWSKGVQTVITEDPEAGRIMRARDAETGSYTSLGADDGIGVAIILGILDSTEITHPPMIAVFTTDEEAGLGGARAISREDISRAAGDLDLSRARMINLDEEEEGRFSVGCAGGVRANLILPIEWEKSPRELVAYEISVCGLTGGHSGMEIDKKRANAHCLLGRAADYLQTRGISLYLSEIGGGEFDNAIAVASHMKVSITEEQEEAFLNGLDEIQRIIFKEYNHDFGNMIEPGFKIATKQLSACPEQCFTQELLNKILTLLLLIPDGVLAMDLDAHGLVETSSNLGVISMEKNKIRFTGAVRSSITSRKQWVLSRMKRLIQSLGGELEEKNDYPGWAYREESKLRDLFLETYRELYGSQAGVRPKPLASPIHAGLECGYFAQKLGDIDIIACGPSMANVHTVGEVLYLDTVQRTIRLLITVLSKM